MEPSTGRRIRQKSLTSSKFQGKDGKDGKDGQSAEQRKDMIASGSADDPHNPGEKWPGNNTVQVISRVF